MGLAVIFIVSVVFFTLTFRFMGSIFQFIWIIVWNGSEHAVLTITFIGMTCWMIYIL